MPEMMKTCSACGGIHPVGTRKCPVAPSKAYRTTTARRLRGNRRWTTLSSKVKQQHKYLCQVCLLKAYNTVEEYNSAGLEVHHIVPLEEDESLAYDWANLITLCRYHHELAERGEIPRYVQQRIVAYEGNLVDIQADSAKILPPYP